MTSAAGLAAQGFVPGTRAIVLSMNNRLLYPLFQGIYRTGATAIPVMPQAAVAELRYVIEDTQAEFIVTESCCASTSRIAERTGMSLWVRLSITFWS